MKKIIALALAAVTAMVVFAGCTTSMSYTFNVETGDAVKVELDTTDGLKLSQNDGTFTVTKDNEEVFTGIFLTGDMASQTIASIESGIEQGVAEMVGENEDEFLWKYHKETGIEYDRLIKIDGTEKTYAVLSAFIQDDAGMEEVDIATAALTLSVD